MECLGFSDRVWSRGGQGDAQDGSVYQCILVCEGSGKIGMHTNVPNKKWKGSSKYALLNSRKQRGGIGIRFYKRDGL